jgi:hypothetical protein
MINSLALVKNVRTVDRKIRGLKEAVEVVQFTNTLSNQTLFTRVN